MKNVKERNLNRDESQTFASVWDALADTPAEAENLKIRSALIRKISSYIKERGFTQTEAAKLCQVTQPRINDLLTGKASKFSLDALINIAASAGLRVEIDIREVEVA